MRRLKKSIVPKTVIRDKIYTVRNVQVMLDEDLARLYGVETKVLNQALKRNLNRFPHEFCFQLTKLEHVNLRSQFVTFNNKVGRKYLPYAFTEQGVAMLSAVLKSEIAIRVSIQIMNAFVQMRKHVNDYSQLYEKVRDIEKEQILFGIKTDKRFDQVFNALASNNVIPKQKMFFEGQVFDAHKFVSDIIRSAKVEIKEFALSHDRFLIVDQQDIYHFGASLKDLGKKWFAVSRFDNQAIAFLKRLERD